MIILLQILFIISDIYFFILLCSTLTQFDINASQLWIVTVVASVHRLGSTETRDGCDLGSQVLLNVIVEAES